MSRWLSSIIFVLVAIHSVSSPGSQVCRHLRLSDLIVETTDALGTHRFVLPYKRLEIAPFSELIWEYLDRIPSDQRTFMKLETSSNSYGSGNILAVKKIQDQLVLVVGLSSRSPAVEVPFDDIRQISFGYRKSGDLTFLVETLASAP